MDKRPKREFHTSLQMMFAPWNHAVEFRHPIHSSVQWCSIYMISTLWMDSKQLINYVGAIPLALYEVSNRFEPKFGKHSCLLNT